MAAARNRVLFPVPKPSQEGIDKLRKLFSLKAKAMRLGTESKHHSGDMPLEFRPMSESAVLNYYGPSTNKARLYSEAYEELKYRSVSARDAKVTMFVKAEKLILEEDESPCVKDPRAIQFRGIAYSARLAQYTLALEMPFYRCTPGATKGLSNADKGIMLSDMISRFVDPVYLELDCSRFDAHVSSKLLSAEHSFYNKVFHSNELRSMLRLQNSNVVYSRHGLKYKLEGGRMSGDMNTALGNNVLQWGMIHTWLSEYEIPYEFVFDGDDSVIVMERKDASKVDPSRYEILFGMKAKLKMHTSIELVEYCKGHFFGNPGGLTFGRKPLDALLKDSHTTIRFTRKKDLDDYMYTLGCCMVHMYNRVPIMWKLANLIRAKYPHGQFHSLLAHQTKRGVGDLALAPSAADRNTLDFNGCSSTLQRHIEASLRV
jgi:hypothetical protein